MFTDELIHAPEYHLVGWFSVYTILLLIHLSCVTEAAPRQQPIQPGAAQPVCGAERGLSSAEQEAEQEGV